MKNIIPTLLIGILLVISLTACSTAPAPDLEVAQQTLIEFFDLLNKGEYAKADRLYAGSYDELTSMNPDISPLNHAALWERGCEQNGLQCLTVRSAEPDMMYGSSYFFWVQFNAPDGSLFVLEPCCGATATEMPPQTMFVYTVIIVNGKCEVVAMPVYIP